MLHRFVVVLVVSLCSALGVSRAAAQDALVVDAARRATALGDGIATGSERSSVGVGYGVAEAVLAVPLDEAVAAVTDYGSYERFMPNTRQSRVLTRRGNNALLYLQVSALHGTTTFWAQVRVYERPSESGARVVEARMREGNLDHFVARWELTPVDGVRTLVRFRVLFVPDLPFPNSLVTTENVRAARHTSGTFVATSLLERRGRVPIEIAPGRNPHKFPVRPVLRARLTLP